MFLLLYAIARVGASAHVPFHPSQVTTIDTSPSRLPYYAARSLLRMFVALFFAYAFSLGYAYAAARSRRARRVLIPALDIGGQFATLQGTPAAALAGFARQHKVTEMVLARTAGGHAGRHPTARELARRAGDAEVHVLPVQAIFAARSDG